MDWFLLPPLRRYESKLQLQPLVSFLLFTVGYLSFWKHREKREGESSQTHREKLNRGETERQPKRTHGAKKEKDEDVRFQYRDKRREAVYRAGGREANILEGIELFLCLSVSLQM